MDRRKFISKVGLIGGLGVAASQAPLLAYAKKDNDFTPINDAKYNNIVNANLEYPDKIPLRSNYGEVIKPKALKRGDTIAITAPASPTSMGEIAPTVKLLKNLGFNVVIGDTIRNQNISFRYLSDDDVIRAEELMKFVKDDSVSAILCGRGGYGVMRTFPYLDFSLFSKHPKIIIGFSDITALLLAIHKTSNLVCFHGPVATTNFDSFTLANFTKVLFDEQQFSKIDTYLSDMKVINEGKAIGKITGGNLRLIISTMGTPYEINTDDSILFLEEINEHPYEIDRMLTQLVVSGKLNNVKGIVFGKFSNVNKRMPFHPFASFTIIEIIEQLLKPYNIPIVYNLPFGHTDIMLTLPFGINLELNTKNKTITFLEPAVTII